MSDIGLLFCGVLSIEASFFDVVDGHQDLGVFRDLVSLLFGNGGCFISEFSLLSHDAFMDSFESGDVVVQ